MHSDSLSTLTLPLHTLYRRPAATKQSGIGHTTTLQFQQTKQYLIPLYERLKHRSLHEELRAGLWMMVEVSMAILPLSATAADCVILLCMP